MDSGARRGHELLLANSKIKHVLSESSSCFERENRIRQQHQDTCKNRNESDLFYFQDKRRLPWRVVDSVFLLFLAAKRAYPQLYHGRSILLCSMLTQ